MSHSEKAAVIALHHSKMFSQGKRNDILTQLTQLENDSENGTTFSQVAKKLNTAKEIGATYSLSKDTVARYLRINKLHEPLKNLLDEGKIAFVPAVSVSFLTNSEQEMLEVYITENGMHLDLKKATMLKEYSQQEKLDIDTMYKVLSGSLFEQTAKPKAVKINGAAYSKYFAPEQSQKEIEAIVEAALALYFGKSEVV